MPSPATWTHPTAVDRRWWYSSADGCFLLTPLYLPRFSLHSTSLLLCCFPSLSRSLGLCLSISICLSVSFSLSRRPRREQQQQQQRELLPFFSLSFLSIAHHTHAHTNSDFVPFFFVGHAHRSRVPGFHFGFLILTWSKSGDTALCLAAAAGNVKMAKIMVVKNETLLTIRGSEGLVPLCVAAFYGNRETVDYLYEKSNKMAGPDWKSSTKQWLLLKSIEFDLFGEM